MRTEIKLIPLPKPEMIDSSKIKRGYQEPQAIEMQDLSKAKQKKRKTVLEYFRSSLRWVKSRLAPIKKTSSPKAQAESESQSDSTPLLPSTKFSPSAHYCPDCHVGAVRKLTWEGIILTVLSCGVYCCCNETEYQCPKCGLDIIDYRDY